MSLFTSPIIILWICLIVALLLSSIYFLTLRQRAGYDLDRQRIMLISFIMFLSIGLSRFFHLIAILRQGSFEGDLSLENEYIFTVSQVFLFIGMATIFFSFEKKIKRWERYYYTIIIIIVSVIYFTFRHLSLFNKTNNTLIILDKITSYTGNIILGLFGLYLSLMYLKISIKTSGSVKKKGIFLFLGFLLVLGSYVAFVLEDLLVIKELTELISLILVFSSIPLLIFGYK
jgi:hypothetical protein